MSNGYTSTDPFPGTDVQVHRQGSGTAGRCPAGFGRCSPGRHLPWRTSGRHPDSGGARTPMTTSEQLPQTESAVSRRSFLTRGAATGLGIVLIGSIDSLFGAAPASARPGAGPRGIGYG